MDVYCGGGGGGGGGFMSMYWTKPGFENLMKSCTSLLHNFRVTGLHNIIRQQKICQQCLIRCYGTHISTRPALSAPVSLKLVSGTSLNLYSTEY